MKLENAIAAAKAYSEKHKVQTNVVREPDGDHGWYEANIGDDLEGEIIQVFTSNVCPECDGEGRFVETVPMIYSGTYIPNEKYHPCDNCDGRGLIDI